MDTETTALSLPAFEDAELDGLWHSFASHAEITANEAYARAMFAETEDAPAFHAPPPMDDMPTTNGITAIAWDAVLEDDLLTQPCDAMTTECPAFEAPTPIPASLEGPPAYLVELRAPRKKPSLFAIRTTLEEAYEIACSVHPSVADIVIREMPLPCDVEALGRALGQVRTWSREPTGRWSPELDLT